MPRSSILVMLAGAVWMASAVGAAMQDRFPDGAGKAEVVRVCNGCHDAEIILANLKTAGEWTNTLHDMAEQGAEASPDEWKVIESYIDANFALIPVNKAGADELARTIDVAADVAAAIVKARQDNGPFKSVDDIKKVAGVDAAKVDARKNRFVF
jgi:competence protein ComEA